MCAGRSLSAGRRWLPGTRRPRCRSLQPQGTGSSCTCSHLPTEPDSCEASSRGAWPSVHLTARARTGRPQQPPPPGRARSPGKVPREDARWALSLHPHRCHGAPGLPGLDSPLSGPRHPQNCAPWCPHRVSEWPCTRGQQLEEASPHFSGYRCADVPCTPQGRFPKAAASLLPLQSPLAQQKVRKAPLRPRVGRWRAAPG